ncbi:hypothetical protein ACWCPT_29665 [Streptomyces sp. NPDC002308]
MNDANLYSYTDPTDAFANTLTVMPVEAATYHGNIPVVSLGVDIHRESSEPDTPVVYVPVDDIEQVIAALRTAAARAAAAEEPTS